MVQLLQLDASPRRSRSHTRTLVREFAERWSEGGPGNTVIRRDLGHEPPPHLTEDWIAAAFTTPGERTTQMREALAYSDQLVDELFASDVLVLGVPMYNFGVPAMLKAYIDQIVRVGRTFSFDPEAAAPYTPLVSGKRAFVIVGTGDAGYEMGGPLASANHVEPYLRTALGFIGIDEVEFVYTGNDEFGGERLQRSLAFARNRVAELTSVGAVSHRHPVAEHAAPQRD
ncbi:FMN-dependent NADH-azoreductase [Nocardia sp. NPDC058497]|uniref:FMN-dependent NADH-azoreductase n=1 Tax=Nocardia sp. NPDC058497 TaxID=3346529 RepID=UPI00364E5784